LLATYNNIVVFDYFIHSLYTVINTQRGCHTLKKSNFSFYYQKNISEKTNHHEFVIFSVLTVYLITRNSYFILTVDKAECHGR